MAWAGGVWNSTYGTSASAMVIAGQVYYDRKFMSRAIQNLYMMQFGQKRPLPKSSGRTIEFYRYHAIPVSVIGSLLVEGTNPDPTVISGHKVQRTLEEFGEFSQHSSLLDRTFIDPELSQLSGLWGDHAGKTIDLRISNEVVTNGAFSIRADGAVSGAGADPGCYIGTVSGTTCTTSIVYCENAFNGVNDLGTSSDNSWIGGQITFTSGTNYGQSRFIYDSTAATHSVEVKLPFENIPASGDTFIVSHPGISGAAPVADAMDGTDPLIHKSFQKLLISMRKQKAMPFNGYYVLVLGPEAHGGFMSDSVWTPLMEYRPSLGESGLIKGEVGKYMGFRVVETTQPFRATLPTLGGAVTLGPGQSAATYITSGSNYSESGTGHYSLAIGQEAYGITLLPGLNTPKIIVKNPGPTDTSNPLNRFSTIGWELPFVPCALNALWARTVVSGA